MAALPEPLSRFAALQDRLDPHLLLADAIGYADHFPTPPGPGDGRTYPVSIELAQAFTGPDIPGLTLRAAHAASTHVTGTATAEAVSALAQDYRVVRTQWAQPLLPQRARTASLQNWARKVPPTPEPSTKTPRASDVLLAVIDNGCPFAHLDLRRPGTTDTRVVRLWDQNPHDPSDDSGVAPVGFGYGGELTQSQLNALMQAATSASGVVDEERCYRLAGYEPVLRRRSHGAHALGMLAGARRWAGHSGAPGPLLPLLNTDAAANADIVFVQFPQQLMDCVSVASLEHHAIDAFRYIQRIGAEGNYSRAVVSFGYESWVGPHNGSTWFESALSSLVDEAFELQVYLVAGNAKDKRAHVRLGGEAQSETVHLRLPPDQEIPTFVEVWAPSTIDDLQVRIEAPNSQAAATLTWGHTVAWPAQDRAQVAAAMHRAPAAGEPLSCALLRWAPTRSAEPGQAVAPHGVWSIRVSSERSKLAGVHAYVGRAQADMGAPRRGLQPHFVRRTDKQEALDREGTLNGHACGTNPRIVVVGAYYGDDFPYRMDPQQRSMRGRSADYSASGLTNGERQRPDVSVPVDDGLFLAGSLAMGTRSACVIRMNGTSVAAPLLARRATEEDVNEPPTPRPKGTLGDDLALGDTKVRL